MNRPVIDVIIPVYNQPEYVQQCIDSLLHAKCSSQYEIVVIDDASPDPAIGRMLKGYAGASRITLLQNQKNLGFTGTVNRGMRLHPDRDVLLLNSDTIVYHDWLDRLADVAYSGPSIASVNPLTNQRGSHISCYPGLVHQYDGELEADDQTLSSLAREVNKALAVNVHTTVGFCMYIRRACLDDIGVFDIKHFPIAYGEESDFCYRARKAGWEHRIAGDAFVTHLEGRSFSERKARLMADMLTTFTKLHPEVAVFDRKFRSQDPVAILRERLDLARLRLLLAGSKDIAAYEKNSGPSSKGQHDIWLELDEMSGIVSFVVNHPEHFPNLPSYHLPRDIVALNMALHLARIERVSARSERAAQILGSMSPRHDDEIGLTASLIS